MKILVCLPGALICFVFCSFGQVDSTLNNITQFPSRLFGKINSKTSKLDDQLTKQTEKYLNKLSRQEAKLKRKLYKLDSNGTKNLFLSNPEQQYASYIQRLKTDSVFDPKKVTGEYLPYEDSLQGSLSFLNKNPQLLSSSNIGTPEIRNSIAQVQQLQARMQDAEQIKQYIQQRKEQIKQYLLQSAHLPPGIRSIYNDYNQKEYYYSQQLNEYKDELNDPDKMFKTVLAVLDKLPAFQNFIKNNSILASLFPMPGNYGSPLALAGLETRDQISESIQAQLSGPNAMGALSQNMGGAETQLSQLKDKIMNYGQGGGNVDVPNFNPNQQKTKSFLKRIEFGSDIQTQQSTYYFPTTTDIGLSIGYKMSDKSTIGIGGSYKIGWGSSINHINISSQGVGLRSYLDVKMKGSIYLSGGLEYNYQQVIYSIQQIKYLSSWQQSGLIGLSKIVSIKTKLFKKTKVQLLWDFLSYQQIPRTQPFKVRVGYNF